MSNDDFQIIAHDTEYTEMRWVKKRNILIVSYYIIFGDIH